MELTSKPEAIPLHLIAGGLGVGKTTAIRRFVAQSLDFVAILVNDFGETGYDAAFIGESGGAGVRIENVPGGCLCCTSAAQLLPALKKLCATPEIQRIIIEPSGIALLDPLLKMLSSASDEYGFELMPTLVLFDPAKTRPASLELMPYWKHLMDRADIVVLNRCDLAPEQAIQAFSQWVERRNPPKIKIIQTSHGQLPQDLFGLRGSAVSFSFESLSHAELPPAGTFRSDRIFRLAELVRLLEKTAAKLERFKGVFQTNAGWQRLEIAGGRVVRSTAHPAIRSSADWIGISNLTEGLKACENIPRQD